MWGGGIGEASIFMMIKIGTPSLGHKYSSAPPPTAIERVLPFRLPYLLAGRGVGSFVIYSIQSLSIEYFPNIKLTFLNVKILV